MNPFFNPNGRRTAPCILFPTAAVGGIFSRYDHNQIKPLAPMEAEFGLPQWVFGLSTFAFESDQRLICAFSQKGSWQVAEIDLTTDKIKLIATPFTDIT